MRLARENTDWGNGKIEGELLKLGYVIHEDRQPAIHFLIHDNDGKFAPAFDTVVQAEHIHIIHTPFQAPNANAFAERWVRTVREECLDKLLIVNQTHLRRVLREFIDYYNTARPHQGLDQHMPIPPLASDAQGPVHCRDVLGGIIQDYFRAAA